MTMAPITRRRTNEPPIPANWNTTRLNAALFEGSGSLVGDAGLRALDLRVAPDAGGLFLGDYEGLAAVGNGLLAFIAKTNTGDLDNRTDVIAARIGGEGQRGEDEG